MKWQRALKIVVRKTGHVRFEQLCADEHPDHEYWRNDMIQRAKMPSLATQASSFIGAASQVVVRSVTGQQVLASPEEQDARRAICNGCEKLVNDRCVLCGCYLVAKIALAGERCPIGKWEAIAAESPVE